MARGRAVAKEGGVAARRDVPRERFVDRGRGVAKGRRGDGEFRGNAEARAEGKGMAVRVGKTGCATAKNHKSTLLQKTGSNAMNNKNSFTEHAKTGLACVISVMVRLRPSYAGYRSTTVAWAYVFLCIGYIC